MCMLGAEVEPVVAGTEVKIHMGSRVLLQKMHPIHSQTSKAYFVSHGEVMIALFHMSFLGFCQIDRVL